MMVHDRDREAIELRNRARTRVFYLSWLCCGLAALLVGTLQASAAAGDPPSRVARLTRLTAGVSLEPSGMNEWTQAVPNSALTIGDRLYVNHEGHAELQIGELEVRAWKFTDLMIVNLAGDAAQLAVAQGSVHIRTFALHADRPVELDTPNGAMTVKQPGDFRLDVYTNGGGTLVAVDAGEIEISAPGVSKKLGAGESVHLVGSNPVQVLAQRMPGKDPFDVWSQELDRAFLISEARHYVDPEVVGSQDLDAYGKWSDTLEYGPVWYPSDVPAGWSPYSNGRWTWVAPWGWTWVDADAWGFAPFHYGRWTDLGSRWGWIPGPPGVAPVYMPAAVAFVDTAGPSGAAGAALTGWFPLSAGEPFYPAYACTAACFTSVNLANLSDPRSNPRRVTAANYFGYYHTRAGFHSIHYANQKVATMVVPADLFASGREIPAESRVQLTEPPKTSAMILSHPLVAPTLQSALPQPVTAVPVPGERPPIVVALSQVKSAAAHSETAGATAPSAPGFWLISRTPPPAAGPSWAQQLTALGENRGRPLDPGQLKNLVAGRAAGPATTKEFPPMSSTAIHATSRTHGVQ